MAIEGLDAGLPIETDAFLPLVPEIRVDGPTLDEALRIADEAARMGRTLDLDIRDAVIPDLWINGARSGVGPRIRVGEGGAAPDVPIDLGGETQGANSDLFRDLTSKEKVLISDDFQEPDIWVFGNGWVMSRWMYNQEFNPGDSDPGRSDQGSEPPNILSFAEWLQNSCHADFSVDWVAQSIANEIKSKPDWNAREYGAIIYMTPDGSLLAGPLTAGMTVNEAIAAGLSSPQTNIALPPGFVANGNLIVGVVHSHPDLGYLPNEDLENRYPSSGPNEDYARFDALVNLTDSGTNARFENGSIFAQYILGPDGVLREFNFNEGTPTYATDTQQQRDSRSDLSKDRPCSS